MHVDVKLSDTMRHPSMAPPNSTDKGRVTVTACGLGFDVLPENILNNSTTRVVLVPSQLTRRARVIEMEHCYLVISMYRCSLKTIHPLLLLVFLAFRCQYRFIATYSITRYIHIISIAINVMNFCSFQRFSCIKFRLLLALISLLCCHCCISTSLN